MDCSVLHLPTHSIRLICLATVLCTRKGRPEPLPDVHEWSNRSWRQTHISDQLLLSFRGAQKHHMLVKGCWSSGLTKIWLSSKLWQLWLWRYSVFVPLFICVKIFSCSTEIWGKNTVKSGHRQVLLIERFCTHEWFYLAFSFNTSEWILTNKFTQKHTFKLVYPRPLA